MGQSFSRTVNVVKYSDELVEDSLTVDDLRGLVINVDKPVNEQKCQMIYFTLVELLSSAKISSGKTEGFAYELFQTIRCDEYSDFRLVRKAYVDSIGLRATQRVLTCRTTAEDQESVQRAFDNLHEWTEERLLHSLTFGNKLRYFSNRLNQELGRWYSKGRGSA